MSAEQKGGPISASIQFVGITRIERAVLIQIASHHAIPIEERWHHHEEALAVIGAHLVDELAITLNGYRMFIYK
jgi:hypothetical protein